MSSAAPTPSNSPTPSHDETLSPLPPQHIRSDGLRLVCLRAAAILGVTGVILGAFGAHALRARVSPDLLEIYKTAVFYHLLHAVALLGMVPAMAFLRWPRVTLCLFIFGVGIFSGSLYLLAIAGVRWLGAITPFGGVALIAGWLSMLAPSRPESSR